jgi:Family of unknown function (DUF6282)
MRPEIPGSREKNLLPAFSFLNRSHCRRKEKEMFSRFSRLLFKQLGWVWIVFFLLPLSTHAQSDSSLNLKGAIDFHVHQGPDSVDRAIDADDLARLAKKMGMRGLVMKNHWEDTAALVYMVRKEVPGIELFGGITQDLAVGGINLEAVKHMAAMKGGWGRVVWLPTFDAENVVKTEKGMRPFVRVSENGHLLPGVLELIAFIAQHHDLVLETGHISGEEGDLVVHEARQRGVTHVVVTHAMAASVRMTIPQMQAATQDGAFIEFVYGATLGTNPVVSIGDYAKAIRAIGPKSCILATDFGSVQKPPEPQRPLEPQGLLDFMTALHKQGISVADIDLMTKTNPALALGLKP